MTPAEWETWLRDPRRRPLLMGVLNVTPDSFSDGGQFADADAAVGHARQMADAGAELIDLGGESTRPGSQRVDADEQLRRLAPVLDRLCRLSPPLPALLSIDTTRAAVAEAALNAGAVLVNDISAGRDDAAMLPLVASRGASVVLMHMQGEPATMQQAPSYADAVSEVADFLGGRAAAAEAAGVAPHRVLVDPGIGFGKALDHNLQLLRRLHSLTALGRPLVLGTSRKGFIARLSGEAARERLFGTAATVAWCVTQGASVVRVHDVEPMRAVVRMAQALRPDNDPVGT